MRLWHFLQTFRQEFALREGGSAIRPRIAINRCLSGGLATPPGVRRLESSDVQDQLS
jgi:hypothetical protein